MKGTSWTLAAPFKEERHHRTPSESIANNYTPSASDLKMKDLPKMQRSQTKCNYLTTLLYRFYLKVSFQIQIANSIVSVSKRTRLLFNIKMTKKNITSPRYIVEILLTLAFNTNQSKKDTLKLFSSKSEFVFTKSGKMKKM